MSSQPNVMINSLVDSIKESLNEANMLGFESFSEQTIEFFKAVLGFAALTQPLNSFAMKNWRKFSTQSYFDASGIFVVIVYALPLICNGTLALVFILKATVSLMIETKRAQLKSKMRQSSKNKSKKN
ncbi:transmembrane protein 18-domain-containing protein [Pilaira anomala]|nr:transmembrane protein 18-domain-containing protein [Pilaira anomala]